MIYTLGKQFQVQLPNNNMSNMSVNDKMGAKRALKIINDYPEFLSGGQFEISLILPDNDPDGIKYVFTHIDTQSTFSYRFKTTADADNLIAIISNTLKQLQTLRNKISDFCATLN